MAAGQERYYTDSVAGGREDYYLGKGEAPGHWLGGGARDLGIDGEVHAQSLSRILGGADPQTGNPLGRLIGSGRVAGWDATFSATKSISLLWALGAPGVSRAVRQAHDGAVQKALEYIEQEAAKSRRGLGGTTLVGTTGFVAAAFRHRTSRALDPQLHSHVLIANIAHGVDGRWGALDGRLLYAHARTAGFLYEAELRHRLTEALGVEFGQVRNGIAELARVPSPVLREFSRRRQAIEARLSERGHTSARAARVATLDTRERKPEEVNWSELTGEWQERARKSGFGEPEIQELLHRQHPKALSRQRANQILGHLTSPSGLTKQASSFSRRHVLRGIAEQFQQGSQIALIEALADGLLASNLVIPLGQHGQAADVDPQDMIAVKCTYDPATPGQGSRELERWSTPEMLATEAALLLNAESRQGEGVAVISMGVLEAKLADRPALANQPEQRALVARLATSGAGVEVVRGKAGTGKPTSSQRSEKPGRNPGMRSWASPWPEGPRSASKRKQA